MTDNLASMVEKHEPQPDQPKEEELDLQDVEVNQTEESPETTEVVTGNDIGVSSLAEWFPENLEFFNDINHVKVQIRGIDSDKTLMFTTAVENSDERNLNIIKDANDIPVLDKPGSLFEAYDNGGIKIQYQSSNNSIIKSYCTKTGLIITHCVIVDEMNIPIKTEKLKKKKATGTKAIEITTDFIDNIKQKIEQEVDLENIILLYPQIQKHSSDLKTIKEVIVWMLKRQETIEDINHHLVLDELMIQLIG